MAISKRLSTSYQFGTLFAYSQPRPEWPKWLTQLVAKAKRMKMLKNKFFVSAYLALSLAAVPTGPAAFAQDTSVQAANTAIPAGRENLPRGTALNPQSRLKDILSVEAVRDNQLIGYGLVVGLNGTGDVLLNVAFAEQSLVAMLERLGVNIKGLQPGQLRAANVAAVAVTATLPPFARVGTRIDVNVSSLGDASDLRGGTLLATSLSGPDGNVYAVAQGPVAVAGFSASGTNASITQGVPTNGRIVSGATVEATTDFELADMQTIRLSLHNPDFTTAKRVADEINRFLRAEAPNGIEIIADMAVATDPATIQLTRQVGYPKTMVDILTDIEKLQVEPDIRARVLIDERTGLIIMGADVRISPVAIAQGNLIIQVSEEETVVPGAPGGGLGGAAPSQKEERTDLTVEETGTTELVMLPTTVSLQDLVDGLNALGVGPRDMISILQAIKTQGALQAEIVVM